MLQRRARTSRASDKKGPWLYLIPHTYLDGMSAFTSLWAWGVGAGHSTASTSDLKLAPVSCLVHRARHCLNLFLTCAGPRAGRAPSIFCEFTRPNPSYVVDLLMGHYMPVCELNGVNPLPFVDLHNYDCGWAYPEKASLHSQNDILNVWILIG
jgi:hypothetical protein